MNYFLKANKNLLTYSLIILIVIPIFGLNFFISFIGNILILLFLIPLLLLALMFIGFNSFKSKINKNKEFKLNEVLKKLYSLGSRNLLVEGGDKLTKSFINDKIFNKFYLFKSSNNLSKNTEFVEFNSLNTLKSKYRLLEKLDLDKMRIIKELSKNK